MWPIIKVVLAAILAMLDWLGSPGAAPSGLDDPVLAPGTHATAGVFALLRAVDPCAMHDIAAAAVVTGDQPDQILPAASLAACQVRLHNGPGQPTWTFTVEVGVALPPARRQASATEDIDGRRLYRSEDTGLHSRSCSYTRPMGPTHGINLIAAAPAGEAGAAPCPMAKAYLSAGRVLSQLVLRGEKRTQPRLALASEDPCAAAGLVLDRLGVPGRAYPQALYECRVQPQPPRPTVPAVAPVTISFGFGVDPAELAGADAGHVPVTVDGHRGVVAAAGSAQQCVITVAYDPDMAAVQLDRTRWVQTVSVHTSSCDQAKALADVVVHEVGTG